MNQIYHLSDLTNIEQASGNVGSSVLPELLKSDLVLSAVTRETSSAKFPEGVTHVKSDFSLSSLTEAFKGQDAVISMLPITALGDQAVVIEAAIAAGVKRFIPSEYGSDSTVSTDLCISLYSAYNMVERCCDRCSALFRGKEEVLGVSEVARKLH